MSEPSTSDEDWGPVEIEDVSAFGSHLARLLDVDRASPIRADEGLFDDWGLDSLEAFQLLITVEAMAGLEVPPAELPSMLTVGDAYRYYCAIRSDEASSDR